MRKGNISGPRVRFAGAALALAAIFLAATPLPVDAATTTTSTSAPAPGVEILNGITVGPAVVTTPGQPKRSLDANQTAAFLQTWLPDSIFQHLAHQKPPSCLPISRLHLSTTSAGTSVPIVALYATDGANAWVGMPAQTLGWASVTAETWVAAPKPALTIATFAGNATASNIAGGAPPSTIVPTKTGTTIVCNTAADKPPTSSSSSSNTTAVIIAVIAGIALLGVVVFIVRSRRKAGTT